MSKSLDSHQDQLYVGSGLGPNCLQRLSADDFCASKERGKYFVYHQAVYWIPENFPSSSVVVVSTLSSDAETIKVLGERQYVTIEMEPLPLDNQHEMCVVSSFISHVMLSSACRLTLSMMEKDLVH